VLNVICHTFEHLLTEYVDMPQYILLCKAECHSFVKGIATFYNV
jgi:hypothetical protein